MAGEAVSVHTLPGKHAGILHETHVAIAMGKVSEAKPAQISFKITIHNQDS